MRIQLAYFISFLTLLALAFFAYHASQIDFSKASYVEGNLTDLALPSLLASPQVELGEKLFRNNCATCHKVNRLINGPALAGVTKKYENDKDWLYKWVRNSQGLVKAGDTRAVALFEQYNKVIMQSFPTLSDEDIDAIFAFVDFKSEEMGI